MSLSTMVVTDLTGGVAATGSATLLVPDVNLSEDTTITPFKTVLEEATTAKKAQASTSTTQAKTATKVKASKSSSVSENVASNSAGGTTKLDNIFKRASEKYGISYDFLVAVAKAESDFNFKCVSSAGAKGIMQLMPDEIKEFGVTDPYDPEQNIMAAAKLLAAHLKKFNGDFTLAAAAYNAGSGAVKKYDGVPPYEETQNYVKKIKKFMEEGVKVPDKDVEVASNYAAYENSKAYKTSGSGSSTTSTSSTDTPSGFDQGVMATDEDWDKVRITVGSGADAVTMTYGAYQKYKELGSLGVG
ncbi:MAG: lytic transglycosylase domain-containing protein [Eubacterium sp.]|nr:lytic transglycosylase domain-containing protein [Eubacterium sp.]